MGVTEAVVVAGGTAALLGAGFYTAVYLQHSGLVDAWLLPLFVQAGIARSKIVYATLGVQFLTVVLSASIANVVGALGGYFDNSEPRQRRSLASGVYARLYNAHANLYEGFVMSAVAIIVANLTKAPADLVLSYALIYLASRFVYYLFYLTDLNTLRSQTYMVGISSIAAIFVLSLFPNGATLLDAAYKPVAQLLAPLAGLRASVGF